MSDEQRDLFKKDLVEWREERVAQFNTRYFYVLPEPEVNPVQLILELVLVLVLVLLLGLIAMMSMMLMTILILVIMVVILCWYDWD